MGLLRTLRTAAGDVAAMIWPRTCEVCGRSLVDGEQLMCLHCRMSLPRTQFHRSDFNPVHRRLAALDTPVERATSYIYYKRRGAYSDIIRRGKYNGRPELVGALAAMCGEELAAEGFFDGIDVILPVPMHRWKKMRRGYNQSEILAEGLSRATGIPVGDNLRARRGHATQTHRNAYERFTNVSGLFDVTDARELEGCHVLIVDDVITSGATLLSCITALRATATRVRVSVLTLAAASE